MENNNYTGWKKWTPTIDEWARFSVEPYTPFPMQNNEYLLIYNCEDGKEKLVAQYCYENGKLRKFGRASIKNSYLQNKSISPVNDEQVCAFDLMKDQDKTVKLLLGNYGAGKSMLLIAEALELLQNHKIDKIIWLRNNVQVEDTGNMGALPGSEFEKLLPWLGPMIDHVGSQMAIEQMVQKGQLEVPALAYIRGRNIKNAAIICSEAENLTMKQIKLIIGRVAEGSMVWFDGDVRQRDGKAFKKAKGLERMIDKFTGHNKFGYVYLPKTERSETAQMADLLDDDE